MIRGDTIKDKPASGFPLFVAGPETGFIYGSRPVRRIDAVLFKLPEYPVVDV